MTLQNTFYIIGIVFMGLMLILLAALVAAVFVIRAKIMSIHDKIEQTLDLKNDVVGVGKAMFSTAKAMVHKHG